jgi:hypothetical protein
MLMIEYVRGWLTLMGDRRAITSFDKGVIAGVLALAMATEMALGALSMH